MIKKYNCNRCKDRNWLISCKCGQCDKIISRMDSRHLERRYYRGHYLNKKPPNQKMEKHSQWKGGYCYSTVSQYYYTRLPNHPYHNHGYVPNHRLIMEHYLKILFDEDVFIPREYYVNRINRNKQDNSLINLEIVPARMHHDARRIALDMDGRICDTCHSSKTTLYKTKNLGLRGRWLKHPFVEGGWECINCYFKRNRSNYK